jgi:HPt (histidine-containing phosphotransfer) domain-containing protein
VRETQAELRRQLEARWADYAAKLTDKLDDMDRAARPLREDVPADQAHKAAEAVRGMSHRLAGSGATFGFAALGRVASDLETLCVAILKDDSRLSSERRDEVDGLLEDLRRAADVPPDPPLMASGPSFGPAPAPADDEEEKRLSWSRMTDRWRASWSGT